MLVIKGKMPKVCLCDGEAGCEYKDRCSVYEKSMETTDYPFETWLDMVTNGRLPDCPIIKEIQELPDPENDIISQRQIDGVMKFLDGYSFKDKEEVYTNGAELVPTFRVGQALECYHNGDVVLYTTGG